MIVLVARYVEAVLQPTACISSGTHSEAFTSSPVLIPRRSDQSTKPSPSKLSSSRYCAVFGSHLLARESGIGEGLDEESVGD